MAELYNLEIIKRARLAYAITDTATSCTLASGQGETFMQPRCVAVLSASRRLDDLLSSEHVIVSSRSGDVLTIERGVAGTQAAWPAGTYVLGYWSPEHFYEVERALDKIEGFLAATLGRNTDGVVRTSGNTGLAVSNPSGYTISVAPGWALVNEEIFRLDTATEVAVPLELNDGVTYTVYVNPPTQLKPTGELLYAVGTSAPADTLKLAEVVNNSTVVTVTDARTYL